MNTKKNERAPTSAGGGGGGPTEAVEWILIIDDDEIRETTRDILEVRGYRTVTAAGGLEGLEILTRANHDWAVVLIDLVLPDVSGVQVIEKIQELSPLTQVIMMTGYASVDSVVTGLRANVIDYLQKPVDMDFLLATIDRALEHRRRLIVEQRVRQSAREWRLTFDTIPDVILILDAESRVVRLNRAGVELIGLPFSEILGQTWFSLLGLPADAWNLGPVGDDARDDRRFSGEFYLERFRKHFLIASNAILDHENAVTGTVHVCRDITDQKLMHAKMLQAEKLAAVGQLAAGVAHEVNNPLSFIMTNLGQLVTYVDGYKQVVRELIALAEREGGRETAEKVTELTERHDLQYIDSDVSDLLAETLNGLVRIRNIVADMRKLSYMGDDDMEEVELNRLASSAANIVKNEIRLRGRLRLELGEIPAVPGIPGRLSQAILNLLLNAIHALEVNRRDTNEVTLVTGRMDDQVFVRVSDTGVGIPAEILDRIFDPFFTTRRAGEGSGLGLAICQDVALKHHGRVEVNSAPGRGSVFTLWLPLESSFAPAPAPAPSASSAPSPKPRLLLVDDEPEVLKSLSRVLRRDYQLTTANSAVAALAVLEPDPDFDLIVTDLVMHEQDGKEFYREASRRWPEIEPRFVFFTGGAFDKNLHDFQTAMGDRIVSKPLQADEVLAMIAGRLRRVPREKP